jgi:hypothetical protein
LKPPKKGTLGQAVFVRLKQMNTCFLWRNLGALRAKKDSCPQQNTIIQNTQVIAFIG